MSHLFYKNVVSGAPWVGGPTIPLTLFSLFQLMFAIITPALVVGALAERIRFTSYVWFIILFCLFIYFPVAHWAWHPDGFLAKMGVLDFAGGTVVHITAGCAALKVSGGRRSPARVVMPGFWAPPARCAFATARPGTVRRRRRGHRAPVTERSGPWPPGRPVLVPRSSDWNAGGRPGSRSGSRTRRRTAAPRAPRAPLRRRPGAHRRRAAWRTRCAEFRAASRLGRSSFAAGQLHGHQRASARRIACATASLPPSRFARPRGER